MIYPPGATSQTCDIQIVDDSGLAVTGLVAATMPAISYSLGTNAAAVAITLSDLSLITSAYSSGGVKERSGGFYRLDLPNGALATAGVVKLIGDASGKHLLCEPLVVAYVPANLVQILGTALTETAGQIAAAFVKFFNKSSPTGTINSLPDAVAGATGGVAIVGSNVGAATSVSGAVGSVTGNVGGNVVGSVGSVATDGISAASVSAAAVTKIQSGLSTLTAAQVWDRLTSALTTSGSIGKRLVDFMTTLVYAAAPTAVAIDTQLSGTHGSGAWGPVAGTGDFNLSAIVTRASDDAAVPGVSLSLVDVAYDAQTTGEDGTVAGWNVDAGDYVIRVHSVSGYQSHADVPYTVAADHQVAIELVAIAIVPDDPESCIVYGVCYMADGITILPGTQVKYQVTGDVPDGIVVALSGTVTSDETDATFQLPLRKGLSYSLWRLGNHANAVSMTIPDEDSVEIEGLF